MMSMKSQIVDQSSDGFGTVFSIRGKAVRRFALAAALFLPAILLCLGKNTSAQQPAGNHKSAQFLIAVTPVGSLDSKNKKPGDQVEFKTVEIVHLPDGRQILAGTKVLGHVTQSKARSKGDTESSLGIEFDRVALGHNEDVAIKGVVRAVGPNPAPDAGGGGVDYGNSINRNLQHSGAGSAGTSSTVAILTEQSEGVVGIKNMQLGSDGVLTADGKSVKLESGSQVIIRATTGS